MKVPRLKIILLSLISLFSSILYSQISRNDSISIINQINEGMNLSYKLEESKKILDNAYKLSEKKSWKNGMILSKINLGLVYMDKSLYKNAINCFKEAMQIAHEIKSLTNIGYTSLHIGSCYNYIGNKTSSIYYLDKAQNYFSADYNTEGLYKTYQALSAVYQSNNEYYQALSYGLKALKLSRTFAKNENIILSLGNLGQIYYLLNQPSEAIEHFLKAIELAEKDSDETNLQILYLKAGSLYRDLGNNNRALNFFIKSNELCLKNNKTEGLIASLIETGKTYSILNNYDKALNYFLRAKNLAENQKFYPRIIELNNEIADIYIKTEQYHKALVYLDFNHNISKQLNDKFFEASSLLKIAKFFYLQENYLKSMQILEQSSKIAFETENTDLLAEIKMLLADIFYKQGNFEKAYSNLLESYKLFELLQLDKENSLYNMLQSVFEISNNESKLEILKRTNQIERLEKEKLLHQKKQLTYAILFIITILLITLYLILLLRRKNKEMSAKNNEIRATNNALMEINIKLQKQKSEFEKLYEDLNISKQKIEASENTLKKINSNKDRLFSIISHDLRGPIATIVSFIRYVKREIKTLSKKEIVEMTDELDITTIQISNLLENLLQWSMSQTGQLRYNPNEIILNSIVFDTVSLLKSSADSKSISIEVDMKNNTKIIGDKTMISTIIRNLISNSIKFSNIDSKIIVKSEMLKNSIRISIIDHGIGMNNEQLENLFDGAKKQIKRGTNDEKGSGLGLMVCEEFLKIHNSQFEVQSSVGKGTTFSFTLTY